ncbi:MAG: hypothetical protein EGR90_05570 [Lachnospiraceae bacterium]|nr:hypothetical protein [Lachnospiraceae bacterium]
MGINQKRNKVNISDKSSNKQKKLDRELRECMRCKHFWGNNRQCLLKKCYKGSAKPKEQKKLSKKCVGYPYGNENGYCFPCMKKILGK